MKSSNSNPFADLRRAIDQANMATRRLIELVSPDRAAVRPAIAILEVTPGAELVPLPAEYLFSVMGPDRTIEFETVRSETIAPARIERAEPFESTDGGAGVRLLVERADDSQHLSPLRFYLGDLSAFSYLLKDARVYVRRSDGKLLPVRVTPSGVEQGHKLYAASLVGSPGRSLLTAMFHAPLALTFVDFTFDESENADLEFHILAHDPSAAAAIEPRAFRLNCIPVINQRTSSVHVVVEPTVTFEPIMIPEGQVITDVGRVQVFEGDGQWSECLPWLGLRYPWKHRRCATLRYVLAGITGDRRPEIGVVEPRRGPDASGVHFNVAIKLADIGAEDVRGSAATGDHGEQADVFTLASRLLMPKEIDPAELEAEFLANVWLTRSGGADVTDGLRALLQSAALGYTAAGRTAKSPLAGLIPGLRRAVMRVDSGQATGPTLRVELEFDPKRVDPTSEFLFYTVLDRALPLFAPFPMATQLHVHSSEGERTWQRRFHAG